jgi:hypothetical protein
MRKLIVVACLLSVVALLLTTVRPASSEPYPTWFRWVGNILAPASMESDLAIGGNKMRSGPE